MDYQKAYEDLYSKFNVILDHVTEGNLTCPDVELQQMRAVIDDSLTTQCEVYAKDRVDEKQEEIDALDTQLDLITDQLEAVKSKLDEVS